MQRCVTVNVFRGLVELFDFIRLITKAAIAQSAVLEKPCGSSDTRWPC